jgi:hypothetical protein
MVRRKLRKLCQPAIPVRPHGERIGHLRPRRQHVHCASAFHICWYVHRRTVHALLCTVWLSYQTTNTNVRPDMWTLGGLLLLKAADGTYGNPRSQCPSLFSLSHPLDEPRPVFYVPNNLMPSTKPSQALPTSQGSPVQSRSFRPIDLSVETDKKAGEIFHAPGVKVI